VFRDKAGGGEQMTKDKNQLLKRSSKHMESSDVSLDANMVDIHKKIKSGKCFHWFT
jgi:hypothetical protein